MKIYTQFEVTYHGEPEKKFNVYVIDKIELAKSEGGKRNEVVLGLCLNAALSYKTIKGPAIIFTRKSSKQVNIIAHECLHMAIELIRYESNAKKNLTLFSAKDDREEALVYCFESIFLCVLKNL